MNNNFTEIIIVKKRLKKSLDYTQKKNVKRIEKTEYQAKGEKNKYKKNFFRGKRGKKNVRFYKNRFPGKGCGRSKSNATLKSCLKIKAP